MIGRRPAESIGRFTAVGFDLDHTFLRYRLRNFGQLIYDASAGYLVEHKGYPPELFFRDAVDTKERLRMMFRTILDHRNGYLLKIDSDFSVMRGYHGFQSLTPGQISDAYGAFRRVDPRALEVFRGDKWTYFHDFYGAAVVPLIAQISALKVAGGHQLLRDKSYSEIVKDVFEGANQNYTITDFAKFDEGQYHGKWYPKFMADPLHYANPIRRAFLQKLDQLREAGKKVFIVSNNYFAPSNRVLEKAIGPDWLDHFDFVFFEADKPKFFHEPRLSNSFCHTLGGTQVAELEDALLSNPRGKQKVFLGGNAAQISAFLSRKFGPNYEVAFFGDSLYADCVYAFNTTINPNWSVFLILEELQELEQGYPDKEYYNYVSYWGSALHDKSQLAGVAKTYIFHVAGKIAHRSFSSLESQDALEFFSM
jgi:HAD superfamily 5'-nucleotidase-like hydrolase